MLSSVLAKGSVTSRPSTVTSPAPGEHGDVRARLPGWHPPPWGYQGTAPRPASTSPPGRRDGPRRSPVPRRRAEVRRALTERDRRQLRGRRPSQASCSAVISSCPSTKSWGVRDPTEPPCARVPGAEPPRAGLHHPGHHHGHHPSHGRDRAHLHQGVGAGAQEGEAPAVEGDVVAAPQHRALPRAPVLAAEPVPTLARAVGTRGDTGLTRGDNTATAPPAAPGMDARALAPHPKTWGTMGIVPIHRVYSPVGAGSGPACARFGPGASALLTTGCSAGGCSGLGRSAGGGGGKGRRSGGHRAARPGRAPAHTRSHRRSPRGMTPPRRCPRPRSWRGRRRRSPRTASLHRTAALPGQTPRSAPAG